MVHDNQLYEHALYFVSQLYEDDWTPRDTVIDFDGGTISDASADNQAH